MRRAGRTGSEPLSFLRMALRFNPCHNQKVLEQPDLHSALGTLITAIVSYLGWRIKKNHSLHDDQHKRIDAKLDRLQEDLGDIKIAVCKISPDSVPSVVLKPTQGKMKSLKNGKVHGR
jgi:hypothetical protein